MSVKLQAGWVRVPWYVRPSMLGDVQIQGVCGIMISPTKEAHVARSRTYKCRFHVDLNRIAYMRGLGYEMTEYLVPVKWWSYADDRLDARGPAELSRAQVEVRAFSPVEAREMVVREWGSYGSVGTAKAAA